MNATTDTDDSRDTRQETRTIIVRRKRAPASAPAGFVQQPPSTTGWRSIDMPPSKSSDICPRFLHVTEQGAVLRRSGSRVEVTKKEEVLLTIPALKLQGVLAYGNVQITTQCLRALLDEGVWLSFFTRNGSYRGRLQPPAERGGALRRRQWQRSQDEGFCLRFAQAVVRAKILGAKKVAAAYASNYLAETLGTGHAVLRQSLERLSQVTSLDELRGVEGNASRAYFDLFRRWNRSVFPFEGRVKHPASDPINVLLNLGYTLLTRELDGMLESAGLDPAIGFFHAPAGDRPSLACDWVEEFRHPIVDRVVLMLVNRQEITPDHFIVPEGKGGLRITPDGLKKFLVAYEKVLRGSVIDEESTTRAATGFRPLFLQQLARILDSITDDIPFAAHIDETADA